MPSTTRILYLVRILLLISAAGVESRFYLIQSAVKAPGNLLIPGLACTQAHDYNLQNTDSERRTVYRSSTPVITPFNPCPLETTCLSLRRRNPPVTLHRVRPPFFVVLFMIIRLRKALPSFLFAGMMLSKFSRRNHPGGGMAA